MTRPLVRILITSLTLAATALSGCGDGGPEAPGPIPRTYRMGFTPIPPRPDLDDLVATVLLWSERADAGLMSGEAPWDSLLAGVRADSFVIRNQLPLASWLRSLGLSMLVVNVDPTNGLDRSSDASPLVQAGRSLTEPSIQQLFRAYATAVDTLIRPDYMGLASETNLVRALAPAALYSAVVQTASGCAADIRAHDVTVPLFYTVQVETAWGWVSGGGFQGIAQDRADFPFGQTLGLSSYPYFVYADPESLPSDYYSRLIEAAPIPVMVIEGGWSSETVTSFPSTPALQARYIRKEMELLDRIGAVAVFQLTFTDLDLNYWPPAVAPFAYLGLVDVNLAPKPALAEWDAVFARPLMFAPR